jgi:hypothetical protein
MVGPPFNYRVEGGFLVSARQGGAMITPDIINILHRLDSGCCISTSEEAAWSSS